MTAVSATGPQGSGEALARPKEALISPEVVIQTALRIMEQEGLEALSLRRLGTELKINGTSLYHHFANKDEILLAAARHALREIELPPLADDWEKWIADNAVAYRRLLVAKPYLIPLMLNGIRPRTLATAVTETKLTEAGVPAAMQPEMIHALDTTVIGSALVSIAANREGKGGTPVRFDHERILRRTIEVLLQGLVNDFRSRPRRASRSRAKRPSPSAGSA